MTDNWIVRVRSGVRLCSVGEISGVDYHISLRAEPTEVSTARRFVADTMSGCGACGHDHGTALLLVSELVTNAMIHAETDVDVTMRCEGPRMTVEVGDGSAVMPAHLGAPPDALTGRGIEIVATMADYWGVRPVPGHGKVVWFTLLSSPSIP